MSHKSCKSMTRTGSDSSLAGLRKQLSVPATFTQWVNIAGPNYENTM